MNIAPTAAPAAPLAATAPAAPAPLAAPGVDVLAGKPKKGSKKDAEKFKPNAFQSGIATTLRAVGEGYSEQGQMAAAVADQAYIYPIESIYATTKVYKHATKNIPVVKHTGKIGTVFGFLGAFQNLIATGLLRAPGEVVHDVTHAAADQIDGKKTYQGYAGLYNLTAEAPPKEEPQSL